MTDIKTLALKYGGYTSLDLSLIHIFGGGITWDSTWESEYREVQQKAAVLYRKQPLFQLITTGKISQKKLLFENQHLERLRKASRYFAFPFDQEVLKQKIEKEYQSCDIRQDYRIQMCIRDSHYYYFTSSGAMKTGWLKDKDIWYYLDKDGVMLTGLQEINGSRYYLNASGAMQTGWKWLDNHYYCLLYTSRCV